jgi:hypothetical protein
MTMADQAGTFSRLLGAFEDLVGQEEATLRAGDMAAARAVQQRTEPVVAALAALGPAAADAPALARMAALLARRQDSVKRLEDQLTFVRAQLAEVKISLARVARLAPAYDLGLRGNRPRLSLVG